jgi:hypothetical protein
MRVSKKLHGDSKVFLPLLLSIIVVVLIFITIYYIGGAFEEQENIPVVTHEEDDSGGYISPITNLTPEKIEYYEIEYKNEQFYSYLFEFSSSEEAKNFFDIDLLTLSRELARNSSSVESPITIDEYSGYVFKKLENPVGFLTILYKNNVALSLSTGTLNEDDTQSVIKWFIETKI